MSGYAKQMTEAAKIWLEANPDPTATRIRPPWSEQRRAAADLRDLEFETDDPEMIACRAKIRSLGDQINDLNAKLEVAVNTHSTGAYSADLSGKEDAFLTVIGIWLIRWARDGHNVFDLGRDFVAAMLLTDPGDIDTAEFRLPFGGLLMFIPNGFAVGVSGNDFTKIHVLETPPAEDGCRILEICACGGSGALSTSARMDEISTMGVRAFADRELEGADKASAHTLRQIVLGTVAYCSSVEGAAERRTVTRSTSKTTTSAPVHWDVGRTVRIDPRLVQAARAGSREVAFRLKHRHIVRGHYRQQPIGEGRKERKTIWIMPFWKGPAEGAQIVHTYKPTTPGPTE